ncbi:TIR domain-containing protein [Piscinibacter koreensis]|uniref:TIR domain-containing protein n=1 Tax=Piscinibacter koreensis TaxID=2742824 RepID=A0A7Y6NNR5_9BURK|nr:TIR domain-containing protein [Schlegelella koreensis]NUZ06571.1 TIR domain-containing protein [Schlegelella koreensis]
MHRIDELRIADGDWQRTISFWEGNPAEIGHDDPVDLIVVSAFRDDYVPTERSIIGALHRRGLSVAALARDKAYDLRETTGFWLSRPLPPGASPVGAGRILCFEPHFLGTQPAEVVGNLFRGLFPFLRDDAEATVAMAVIATGALGEAPDRMLRALVTAAAGWMRRGLPIRELRIMEPWAERAEALRPVFADVKRGLATPTAPPAASPPPASAGYDVFLSFSKADADAVDVWREAVSQASPTPRLFDYRHSIDKGQVWQQAIDEAMQSCRRMVAFLSRDYFASVECQEELNMARLRHKREGQRFLFPLYVRSLADEAELPLWLQTVVYVDCREADPHRLAGAAPHLRIN